MGRAASAEANRALRDAALRHAIDLHKYSNSVVRDMLAVLRRADGQLMERLAAALLRLTESSSGFSVLRLDEMLTGVRDLIAQINASAQEQLGSEMRDFTEHELSRAGRSLERIVPQVAGRLTLPDFHRVYSASEATPFKGRLLREWFSGLATSEAQRVRDIAAQGMVQGLTVSEMITQVRGTKAANFKDGALNISRKNAEAVVRTAVAHHAAEARDSFFRANADVISEQRWLSTLDARTTPECQLRDGLVYTVEGDPVGHHVPWLEGPGELHWGCRSVAVPIVVIKGLSEFLPPAQRASTAGPVSAKLTYAEWLRTQTAAVQDEVLGPTRAAMYRAGKVSFTRFFNDQGALLTLKQLKARD